MWTAPKIFKMFKMFIMEDKPKREKLLSERSKQELYYRYSPALALAANFALFPKNAAHNATKKCIMLAFISNNRRLDYPLVAPKTSSIFLENDQGPTRNE